MSESKEYKVEIISSSRELTIREKIKFMKMGNAIGISEQEDGTVLKVTGYVLTHVKNDYVKETQGKNTEYKSLFLETPEGIYKTSSETFIRDFIDIWNMMAADGMTEDELLFQIVKIPSQTYKGSDILSCNLV